MDWTIVSTSRFLKLSMGGKFSAEERNLRHYGRQFSLRRLAEHVIYFFSPIKIHWNVRRDFFLNFLEIKKEGTESHSEKVPGDLLSSE